MNYTVNNNGNTTITINGEEFRKWSMDDFNNSEIALDELVSVLDILQKFKNKYPKDETVFQFDEIVRNEICTLFGGELKD